MIGDTGVAGKNDIVKEMASMPCEVKSYELSGPYSMSNQLAANLELSYSVTSVSFVTLTVSPSTVPSTLTCKPFFDLVFFSRSAALVLPLSSNL